MAAFLILASPAVAGEGQSMNAPNPIPGSDRARPTSALERLDLLDLSWKASLASLTMGITHDFCNLMTGIVSLSQACEAEADQHGSIPGGMGLIRTTALQAAELVQWLRRLHQGSPGEKNYHDLNQAISGLVKFLSKVLPGRARIQTSLAEGQLPVYLDAVEFEQFLVHLALNATAAMPDGGPIIFRTSRHAQPPNASILHGCLPELPLVCVSVQDSGAGIPRRHLSSIFEPGSSAGPAGKGSGLRLYSVRSLVEKAGAAISVDTREAHGTTFHLWFHQADLSATPPPEP